VERNFIIKFGKNRVSGNVISPWLPHSLIYLVDQSVQ
jgi:hypothetical protein